MARSAVRLDIIDCPGDPLCLLDCEVDPIDREPIPKDRQIRLRVGGRGLVCYNVATLYQYLRDYRNMEPTSRGVFSESQLRRITAAMRHLDPRAAALRVEQNNPMDYKEQAEAMGYDDDAEFPEPPRLERRVGHFPRPDLEEVPEPRVYRRGRRNDLEMWLPPSPRRHRH